MARVEGGDIVIKATLEEEVSKELLKLSANAGKIAVGAIAAVGTGLLTAGTAAVAAGASFESAFAGVKKTVNATSQELAQMRQGIRDMAKDMPTSANEIARVAEAAGQLGIKNDAILSFTKTMVMLGDSTNMASADAATSLARLANITQMPQSSFDRLGSTVVALGNSLATTESEIVEMGLRLAGAGKQVGMSEATILSFAGALSSVGIEAEAGGSAFSKVMVDMQLAAEQGGDGLQQFADVAGMSADEFSKAYKEDAAGAMLSFIKGLSTCEERGVSAIATLDNMGITEVRMRDALLRAAGASDVFSQALQTGSQAWDENTALTNEASQRYETFESKAKMAKNAIVDLAISLYDSAEKPLKSAADAVLGYAEALSQAFETGGIEALVEKAGDIFADIAVKATEQAPKMVDAAASTIKAFLSGIVSHKEELYSAAVNIAKTLANGVASILPAEMSRPAQAAIEQLANSLQSGGLKEAAGDITGAIEDLVVIIGKVASVALPPCIKAIDLFAKNLKIIVPAATAAVVAFKAFKVIKSVQEWYSAAKVASVAYAAAMATEGVVANASSTAHILLASTMSASELIIGVVTKRVTMATAAQVAWNAVLNANPIGIAVTAVAALTAGLIALTVVMDSANAKSYTLTDEQQKLIDKSDETTQAINQQREAREASVQSIDREYDGYESLVSELQSITDANGNVKAGYDDRAKVITGLLSSALGIEIGLLDGQIQKYGEVIEKIKEVIVQKKAEAVAASMQDDMAKAYEKSEQALKAYKDATSVASDKHKDLLEAQKRVNEVEKEYGNNTGPKALSERNKANQALEVAQTAYDKASKSMNSAKEALSGLSTEVNNYDALVEAMASGNTAKIEEAMNALVTSYRSYTAEALSASGKTRQELYNQANSYVENMKLVQDGTVQVADSVYQDMATAAVNSINEFNKLPGGIAQGLKAIGPEASAAMISALSQADMDGKLDAESKAGLESFINGFSGLDAKTQEAWAQAWFGALKGLEGFEQLADPAKEGAEVFLESLRAALEVHSPSAAVSNIFSNVWPGASEGLEQGKEEPISKAGSFVQEFLGVFSSSGLTEGLNGLGASAMTSFASGISSQSGVARSAGADNAIAASQGASSENPYGIGTTFGSLFGGGMSGLTGWLSTIGMGLASSAEGGVGAINPSGKGTLFGTLLGGGISSMAGVLMAAGLGIATSAQSGAGSVRPTAVGSAFGQLFSAAISLMSGASRASGVGLANSGRDGMGSVSTHSTGTNFAQGFVSGIGSLAGAAISAARSLASSALNAMKSALDIHSPSKETGWMGKMFTTGFVDNVEAGISDVKAASAKLSAAALKGIDVAGITAKLQRAVDNENAQISSAIAASVNYSINDKEQEEQRRTDDMLKKMARYFVQAMVDAKLGFSCDRRQFARLLRDLEGGVI